MNWNPFGAPLQELTEAHLQELAKREIQEGPRLDYKLALPANKGEKKELARDVAAFANAYGGYLIFGIREEEGVARELVGVEGDPDRNVTDLENAIRDRTSRRSKCKRWRS